jgi:hypothetical protein
MQDQAHRRLGEGGRLHVALELSDLTHTLAIAGIKQRHPDLNDEQARRELAMILYCGKR